MPIYEYECPKCGVFEVVQKISDAPLKAKPDCDCADCPKKAEKLISASAFHLKGSGWYKTDYSSSGNAGTSRTPAPSSGSGESASADTSSAASSEPAKDSKKKKTDGSGGGSGGCGSGCACH